MRPSFMAKPPETAGVNMLVDDSAKQAFVHWVDAWSDIREHLFTLHKAARGNVVELGVRGGVSTAALLAGVEDHHGHVVSIDIDSACAETFKGHPLWEFRHGSSIDHELMLDVATRGAIDLLFIDTNHTYAQLKAELEMWAPLVNVSGLIMMHDVESFPDMARAADEYASGRGLKYEIRRGSNGLGIISI